MNRVKRTILVSLQLVSLLPAVMMPVSAAEAGRVAVESSFDPAATRSVTNDIIVDELEILRMNTNYRLESTSQSRWKAWRGTFFSLATYGTSNAGLDAIAYARWKYWHNPKNAPRRLLQAGPLLLLIGHSIGIGGLVIESMFDIAGDHRRRDKGFDRATFNRHLGDVISRLDSSIARRDSLIAAADVGEDMRQALLAESAVLKDIRNGAIEESKRLSVRASKFRAARDSFTVAGIASLATGGYIGSLLSLLAVNEHKARLAGPSGIGFTISGALISATPIITRWSSDIAGKLATRQENRILGVSSPAAVAALQGDRVKLQQFPAQPESVALKDLQTRAAVYTIAQQVMDRELAVSKAEKKFADREFTERLISGALVGGTKMAYGIQLVNAGFEYHNSPPKPALKFKRPFGGTTVTITVPPTGHTPAQLFSKRVAAAATTFLVGTDCAMLDALQRQVRGELRIHKAAKAGLLAPQVLSERLQVLDQAEQMLVHAPVQPTDQK